MLHGYMHQGYMHYGYMHHGYMHHGYIHHIMDTCIMNTCIMDTCIMDTSAWVTRPERPEGAKDEVNSFRNAYISLTISINKIPFTFSMFMSFWNQFNF